MYLRTEASVYDSDKVTVIIDGTTKQQFINSTYAYFDGRGVLCSKYETVIDKSEKLESLVDEYIVIDYDKPFLIHADGIAYLGQNDLAMHKKVFGAIWVIREDGVPMLKPVAKMDGKGALELC